MYPWSLIKPPADTHLEAWGLEELGDALVGLGPLGQGDGQGVQGLLRELPLQGEGHQLPWVHHALTLTDAQRVNTFCGFTRPSHE